MAITEAFTDAIRAGNITRIRIMMKDNLLDDPTFAEFDKMTRLAREGGIQLYESYDKRPLELDKAMWDHDYLDKAMVQLVGNFSQDRIEHTKNVVRHLRPAKPLPPKPTRPVPNQESGVHIRSRTHNGTKQTNNEPSKIECGNPHRGGKILLGAALGAGVGAAIAAGAGAPALVGAGAGAVVAGLAATALTKE